MIESTYEKEGGDNMINRMKEVLCWNCRKKVAYRINARKEVRMIKGIRYHYNEKYAICCECGEELTVPGLDDENENELDVIFRQENNLITIEEISMILEKYNIEKRPLSNLLGFGELTITRYLDGQLPNKRYSDLLKRLLKYDEVMRQVLEEGKDRITEIAYHKVEESIANREYLWGATSRIERVALYMIDSLYEVSNLSLQKLLYYYKALGYVFCKRDMLEEHCEAWVHGPVFTKIYEKYKCFGRGPIIDDYMQDERECILSQEEKKLCDFVMRTFGIYNASILRELTHREKPWLEARGGLSITDRCSNIIQDSVIQRYFVEMNDKFDLQSEEGVENYVKSLDVI